MSQSKALTNSQIIRAALVVLAGFLASGILGFVRTAVLSAQFGASSALDAFYAAQQIPEVIFVLVAGGALGSSFIPVYAQQRDADPERAWELASAVMTLATLAAMALGAVVMLAAPWLVTHILRPDDPPAIQQLTSQMTRLMMLTPMIFAISGLIMGILQSHGLFLLPSIAISMNSIGIMIGAVIIAPLLATRPYTALDIVAAARTVPLPQFEMLPVSQVGNANVYGLAIGAVLSALLHLAVQLPGVRRIRAKLRVLPDWRIPGVRDVLRLMAPRLLGQGVTQVNFLVNIILTSFMVVGSYTAVRTAFTLMFFVLGVIGQSVSSAVFPTLAALYAEGDMAGYKDRLASAMRSILFLALPATIGMIILAEPVVSIFERGQWTAEDTRATAWALTFYATGIAGFALLEVLSRAFYALSDTWTPVKLGIGAMVSNIILSLIFVQFIGEPDNLARGPFAGLALANALTTVVEAALLWWLMSRRIGGINDRHILSGAAKTLAASLIMGAGLLVLPQVIAVEGVALAIAGAVVGSLIFFGSSFALGIHEARVIPLRLLGRFRR